MAHTISERKRRARIQELAPEHARRSRQELRHAQRIVDLWNKRAQRGRRPSFYPTIATVLAAGTPILDVLCPACRTVGSVDIRTLKRHPGMAISGLIPSLSCRMCCPNPPFAKTGRIAQSRAPMVMYEARLDLKAAENAASPNARDL